jgi:hypothetical protein
MDGLPVTVMFSDQNCVTNIEGKNGTCIAVVRQEDASLSDLLDMSREIFENQKVPEGSVFLFGSASYLSRVGTGTYAGDWLAVVSRAEKLWRGIRVCPLIPMILSDCPGTLAREIAEIAAWFASIYENNPLGLYNTWAAIVSASETLSVGGIALPHMDSYKITVPSSLSEQCIFTSMTFCLVSTRPATLRRLPKDNLSVLVHSLVETVHRCFKTCASPENFLARDTVAVASDNCEQKVVLLGASNLGCCALRLQKQGKQVIDLTQPGWLASKENIEALAEKFKSIECNEHSTLVEASSVTPLSVSSNLMAHFPCPSSSLAGTTWRGKSWHVRFQFTNRSWTALPSFSRCTRPPRSSSYHPCHATFSRVAVSKTITAQTSVSLVTAARYCPTQ